MTTDTSGDGFAMDALAAMPDAASRAALQQVLRRWAGARVYLRRDAGAAARAAAAVLQATEPDRPTAVRRLALRAGCTLQHARRLLRHARAAAKDVC